MSTSKDGVGRHVNQWAAVVFGALWLTAGVAAVVVSRRISFTRSRGVDLLHEFSVNGLHGSLMIIAGVGLILAAVAGRGAARRANLVVGALWLVLDVFALLAGHRTINVLAIDGHDADLLLIACLALIAVGLVLGLPGTSGSGPKYRSVRYGQGPLYVDASDLPGASRSNERQP